MSRRRPLVLQRLRAVVMATLPSPHVHWFRWVGEDPYGTGSLYECRCGVVRPGL